MEQEKNNQELVQDQASMQEPEQEENASLDQEIEENIQKDVSERLISSDGLIAEQYDRIPEADPMTEEEQDEFDGREGIRIDYQFTGNEVSRALRVFQRYTIYKKNTIYTLILAVLFFVFLAQVMADFSRANTSALVCVLTVVAAGMLWYFPWHHIRQTAKTVDAQQDQQYIMTLYDDAIVTGEGEGRNVFYFRDNTMKAWELADMYVLGYNKLRIFVLPKRFCQGREEEISKLLRDGLKENYKMIY